VTSLRPSDRVLNWWDAHRRVLPWRAAAGKTQDPYIVWLSEILLQQTTVQTATPYFERFVRNWPRVEHLAAASPEAVMRAFAGLGYYNRARNLIACAREIVGRGGRFPRTENDLRQLPGIGAYTAAAIAAIAFDEAAAPVDGNIARIIARLIALEQPVAASRRTIAETAAALAPKQRAGDYAQALMDLGSMICTPRKPSCRLCPLRDDCAAARSGDPAAYPRKAARRARPVRQGAVFFASRPDGAILVRTRAAQGLLGSTIELPGTAWGAGFDPGEALSAAPLEANWRLLPGAVQQAFTHFLLQLQVYAAPVGRPPHFPGDCFWLGANEIAGAGFSSIMRKALAHAMSETALAA
jgi:A/G-specific adenine glycosylase